MTVAEGRAGSDGIVLEMVAPEGSFYTIQHTGLAESEVLVPGPVNGTIVRGG